MIKFGQGAEIVLHSCTPTRENRFNLPSPHIIATLGFIVLPWFVCRCGWTSMAWRSSSRLLSVSFHGAEMALNKLLELLEKADQNLFLWLNSFNNGFFDTFFAIVTATSTWFPLYALLLFLLYRKFGWKGFIVSAGAVFILVYATHLITDLVKYSTERQRPCNNPEISQLVHTVAGCVNQFSFFSGHSSNSFAIATFVGVVLGSGNLLWVLWAWAAIVAYSRIYIGVHYPVDIVCGALAGICIGYCVSRMHLLCCRFIGIN